MNRWVAYKFILAFAGTIILHTLNGQVLDLQFKTRSNKFDIPFDYENNFILLEVLFNGIFPLRFIFDTGAEHTILAKREITDLLAIDYTRRFSLVGADMSQELYAYLAPGISLEIKNIHALNRSILVLEDDYFRFDAFTGINIHGILGADFFRRFVIQINYRKKVITFHNPRTFKPPKKKFVEYPIEIKRNKPYLHADAFLRSESPTKVKLLMDTGASLPVMLYTTTHEFLTIPDDAIKTNIGMGLGGNIEGYVGRLEKFGLNDFVLGNVVANFQDIEMAIDPSYLNERNGILGNQLMNRFHIIIDYVRGKLYLRPNRKFDDKFKYDRSGMIIVAGGENLANYQIIKVVEGSPADLAGIKAGDKIIKFNGLPASLRGLNKITRKLKKRQGKKIKLTIEREDLKMKKQFELRELLH